MSAKFITSSGPSSGASPGQAGRTAAGPAAPPHPGSPRAGRDRRPRDEARAFFRNGILDAAESVFAEQGFRAARVHDIAERARIAVGTVYNHFGRKEDILHALLEERTAALADAMNHSEGDPPGYPERLAAILGRMLRVAERHRDFFVIAQQYGLMAPPHASEPRELAGRRLRRMERMKAGFRALVEEGVQCGALEPLEPRVLAMFLGASLRTVMMLPPDPAAPMSPEARARQFVDLFLHGASKRGRR